MGSFCWLRKSGVSNKCDVGAIADFFVHVAFQERYIKKISRKLHIPAEKLKILVFLRANPNGVSTSEIIDFYGINRSNLSRIISELKTDGLVTVKYANCYGQFGLIFLLPKGEKTIEMLTEYCFNPKLKDNAFIDFVETANRIS